MKRKFKLKNNLKFYGIISLTFMLLIALGFMGVRDYDGRKNDVVSGDNRVAINNNQQNFGGGSGGTAGTKRTTTTTTTKKRTTTTTTTRKRTSTNNVQIGYFTCVNCTITSCSGNCSYVSGGTSAACYSIDCIVSAKARDGYLFSNGSTISSTRISKTSSGSLKASKTATKPTSSSSAGTKGGVVSISGTGGRLSCSGNGCINSYGTHVSCYSDATKTCYVSASLSDGYGIESNGTCATGWSRSVRPGESISLKTCKLSSGNTETVGKVTVSGGHATLTCTGCASLSSTTATCKTSACGVSIKLESGWGLMDSSKVCVGGIYYHNINSKTNISYTTCKLSGNSGSTNPGGGTTPTKPKTEPKPGNNSTTTVNKWVWAKGSEYQGETIKCGDKLYITTCTNDNDPICNVTSINGKEVKNTKIRKSNYTENEADTGCFQNIKRYVKEKTFSYTNSGMTEGKTEIDCGSIVVFTKSIDSSCSNGVCEVTYNGKKIYLREDMIVADQPTCAAEGTCTTSPNVTEGKGEYNIRICKDDDTEEKRNSIVTCAADYEKSYKLTNDTCKDNNSNTCYKEYKYTCSYIRRPGVSAVPGALGANGKGTITITGYDYGNVGLVGYHVSNGTTPTENSSWTPFADSNYVATIERSAGTYFIWTMNKKNRLSYQVMAKVYDPDLSTTLSEFSVKDADGNNVSLGSLDKTLSYNEDGLVDAKYALLSNNLLADSGDGFDKLTTAYEINTTSNKIAIYATLTSSDASYVAGYEPRTIDLEYGRNVALIKIVNSAGRERTYTFIINRIDDRNNSNLLKNIKLSRGKIDFDPYVTNYTVEISRFTKNVSINAELDSSTASFIEGYEPRKVQITEDVQSAILKVMSEAGSIRSYVITFVRKGNDDDINDSTYLSSLTVPGTQLGFDKNTFDYTITIPYDSENVPVYAFAESDNAVVTVSNNTGLKVGNNLIEIEVKNGKNVRVYSLHVIRKESGLDVSNSAKLDMLTIKNYNIDFNKDVLDYTVKIKREKTLLIAATPESNRADVYMYGNNDLTGFSTVRVKVIAENGLTNIYSIDIQKDAYNKKFEIIASVSGGIIVIATAIIIVVKKSKSKKKEYLEG